MVAWFYQMSHLYWPDKTRDPVEQYRRAVSPGREVLFTRFKKARARRTDDDLPQMRRGDPIIVAFVRNTKLPDGRRIEAPGVYGFGKLTADEDLEEGEDGDVCWLPLRPTKTLARRPMPWADIEAFLPDIRGIGRGTVFPIPPAIWKRLKAMIDKWPHR